MKFNQERVTSSKRKNRSAISTPRRHIRRKLMSAPLSKELRSKYNVPLHADSQGRRSPAGPGSPQGQPRLARSWPSTAPKYVNPYVERESSGKKANGATVYVNLPPSKVAITKLKLDRNRKGPAWTGRPAAETARRREGKYTEADAAEN
uniref:Microtubule-binding protein TANGLED n=1 Tax=Macrostomum lignano TaxID=282301 RepID=A0A1I8FJU8_9PLAT